MDTKRQFYGWKTLLLTFFNKKYKNVFSLDPKNFKNNKMLRAKGSLLVGETIYKKNTQTLITWLK